MCASKPSIPAPPPPPPPPPPAPTRMTDKMRPAPGLQSKMTGNRQWGYDDLVIPMRGTGVNVPGSTP